MSLKKPSVAPSVSSASAPTVLLFAERMLPSTQTYIPAQARELRHYNLVYTGLVPAEKSMDLDHEPILLLPDRASSSKLTREAYRWVGHAPRFHRTLRALGPSLLHAHFAEGGPAAYFLSRALNIPMLLHLHGGAEVMTDAALLRKWFEWTFLWNRKALWRRASAFLCASGYIRDKALQAGFPAQKLVVHYAALAQASFRPSRQAREKEKELVLYLGRLIPYKGCNYLIEAMQVVRQTRPGAHLVIIGDGELRPALEEQARALGVPCTFTGELVPAQVRAWLDEARVLCGPSVTLDDGQSEAFGLVFLEAQAMGTPVVSFRHGGIPETMLEGETGLLAEERDIQTLAGHIERYLADDCFWESSRTKGMQWVRETFNTERQSSRLEAIYSAAIRGYRPGSSEQELA